MRPKKRILMFSTNEAEGQRIAFVLQSRAYAVRVAHTPEDYRAYLPGFRPDCVLILFRGEGRPFAIEAAQLGVEAEATIVTALMGSKIVWEGLTHAIVQERREGGFMAELLDQLRICCSRKRGPRKEGGVGALRIAGRAHGAAEYNARMLA